MPREARTTNRKEPAVYKIGIWQLRGQFLKAIQIHAPEVLESLRDRVLPHFTDHLKDFEDYAYVPHWRHPTLLEWAGRYGLKKDWVLEVAALTLCFWSEEQKYMPSLVQPELRWSILYSHGTPLHPAPPEEPSGFKVSFFGWNPALEDWNTYRRWVRSKFEVALKEHESQMKAWLAEFGNWTQPSQKRNPAHFEWLVHRQVHSRRYSWIAENYDIDEKSVKEAVKNTAGLLGLSLKPLSRGRPRGSKDRYTRGRQTPAT